MKDAKEMPQEQETEDEEVGPQEEDLPENSNKKHSSDAESSNSLNKKRKVGDGPVDTPGLELADSEKPTAGAKPCNSKTPATLNSPETPIAGNPKASPLPYQQPSYIQPMLPYPYPAGMFPPQHGMIMASPYMNFPMPDHGMIYPGSMPMPGLPMFQTPNPAVSPGIPLSLSNDIERLSEYQTFLRQQFEFFQAGPTDAQSSTQGRKRPVVLGQVGIRCRHCISLPLRSRGRGSVYYPSNLIGIYQAGQNMAGSHLATSCPRIPPQIRQEFLSLKGRRDNANGGKKYWADGARALGVYEVPSGGLRWSHPLPGTSTPGTPYQAPYSQSPPARDP